MRREGGITVTIITNLNYIAEEIAAMVVYLASDEVRLCLLLLLLIVVVVVVMCLLSFL